MTTIDDRPRPVPVPVRDRALAPDLARGAMLLLIALANATGVVYGGELSAEPHPHGAERGANIALYVAVHARAYPMFAILFGYGIVQLARRQEAAGLDAPTVRGILIRRNAWLIVFGAIHAALLYSGDFLGAYGIVGIVCTVFLLRVGPRIDRISFWLWALTAVDTLILTGIVALRLIGGAGSPAGLAPRPVASLLAADPWTAFVDRVREWPVHTVTVLPFIMIVWLGMVAAKRGVLENAGDHRRLLRWVAGIGLGVAFLGGLPLGLVSGGYLAADPGTISWMNLLQGASGLFGGPGYIAVFGLLAARIAGRRRGPVTTALAALGRRSLSGYLWQSVAWLVLFAPYTLDLGHRRQSPLWTAMIAAGLVWSVSVVGAALLGARPGPAERALRQLTYRTRR